MATSAPSLLHAYIALGGDDVKIKLAASRLKAKLQAASSLFNYNEFDGHVLEDISEVIACARSLPVMDTLRVVVIHNVQDVSKTDQDALIAYLKDPNPSCVMYLSSSTLTRASRLVKAVMAQGEKALIDCSEPKRTAAPEFVARLAKSRGLMMDMAAISELIERVGTSARALTNQIDMLQAHALSRAENHLAQGQRGDMPRPQMGELRISRSDILELVDVYAKATPWEFLDALSMRDRTRALNAYARLQKDGVIGLISLVEQRIRALICARELMQANRVNDISHALNMQVWQTKNYPLWANQFSEGELERLFMMSVDVEARIKTGDVSDAAFLELICTMCPAK